MSHADTNEIAPDLIEAAASWHMRLTSDSVTDKDQQQHMDWLLESPAHLEAYEHVMAALHVADTAEVDARQKYAGDFATSEVGSFSVWDRLGPKNWNWPQVSTALAGVAALLFIAIFPNTSFYDAPNDVKLYASTSTDLKRVKLTDGSRVTLFAGSSLEVRFRDERRSILMHEGRAFFDVVSDSERPFLVQAGQRQIKVVGTRFEVLNTGSIEQVAVNEGLVAVSNTSNDSESVNAPILLEPGTVARYNAEANVPTLSKIDAETIGEWTGGVLVFSEAPLTDVITKLEALFPDYEFTLASGLKDKRFSGTLVVSSPERMLEQLAGFMALRSHVSGKSISLQ